MRAAPRSSQRGAVFVRCRPVRLLSELPNRRVRIQTSRKNGRQMMQRLRRTRSALLVRTHQRLARRRKEVHSARNSSRSLAHLRSRTGAAPLRRLRMLGRHSRTLTKSCLIRTTACMRSSGLPRTSMVGTAILVPPSDLAKFPLRERHSEKDGLI